MPKNPVSNRSSILILLAAGWVAACGPGKPPPELVSARSTYDEAEEGQAKELVPDRLLEAKQALDAAENRFRSDGDSPSMRALAYIADRKAQLAMAMAAIAASKKIRVEIERDYQRVLELQRQKATGELSTTKQTLSKREMELAAKEEALRARERELAAKKEELATKSGQLEQKDAELEAERQARIEAEKKAAEAMASLKEIAQLKEDKRGMVITLSGGVLFKTNSSELLDIARSQLGQVAEALKQQDETKPIVVEGHTDSRGSSSANRRLSLERAESVRFFLISRGLPAERIRAVGKGEDEPVASNKTAEGRANNRRVEIVVGGQ